VAIDSTVDFSAGFLQGAVLSAAASAAAAVATAIVGAGPVAAAGTVALVVGGVTLIGMGIGYIANGGLRDISDSLTRFTNGTATRAEYRFVGTLFGMAIGGVISGGFGQGGVVAGEIDVASAEAAGLGLGPRGEQGLPPEESSGLEANLRSERRHHLPSEAVAARWR
jgi:hypothetical protein